MTATYEETLAYLETRFLTLEQLSKRSGLAAARLEGLIATGLMPCHSHEATFRLSVYARVNGHHPTTDRVVRYYHPDLVELAKAADEADRELGESAAAAMRARHDDAVAETSRRPPGHERDAFADAGWWMWLDGTIGVCLQRFGTANIVRKAEALETMAAALSDAAAGRPVDRPALAEAVATYAQVTGPFGPHERDGSSRAKIYEPAVALAERLAARAA
jgi:hypothetical protein